MIYIIDDAADFRLLVQQVFQLFLSRYPVRFFADGADFIQHVEVDDASEKPRLIILDVDMPRLNGLETLERLKQQSDWQTIPVIMMTNREAHEYMRECYSLGASSFLLKPLDLNELKENLALICRYWLDLNQLPVS